MASQWHYRRGGEQHGPFTSTQLKELSAGGRLLKTDLVRKQGMADWVPAGTLNGLFPGEEGVMPASVRVPAVPPVSEGAAVGTVSDPLPPRPPQLPPPPPAQRTVSSPPPAPPPPLPPALGTAKRARQSTPPWIYPSLAVLMLTCCFPLGLVLVWVNPAWSNKTKSAWTATWGGVVVLLAIIGGLMEYAGHKRYAEANAMWESGRRAESVERYRDFIANGFEYVDRDQRPRSSAG